MQTIFNYHYDQILREIKQTIPAKDQPQVMDSILDYMEEVIDWCVDSSVGETGDYTLDNFIDADSDTMFDDDYEIAEEEEEEE